MSTSPEDDGPLDPRYQPPHKIVVRWVPSPADPERPALAELGAGDERRIAFIRDTGDPEYDFVNNIPTATVEELATLEDLGKARGGPLDGARLLLDGTRVLVRRDPPPGGEDGDRVVT